MTKKKKLLIFQPTVAPYRVDLYNDLSKIFDTKICFRKNINQINNPNYHYDNLKKKIGNIPFVINEEKKGSALFFYLKQLRDFDPDIVLVDEFYLSGYFSLLWKGLCKRKCKIFSICDDNMAMLEYKTRSSLSHHYSRKLMMPLLNGVVLVTPEVTKWYQQHYDKGFYFPIIRNEATLRKTLAASLEISRAYIEKYNLQGLKTFLFVGRLVKLKNIDTLIRAFSEAQLENAALLIVGNGPEKEELQKLVQTLPGNIHLVGGYEAEALYAWYNVASIFVLPSVKELFGAVTVEALIAGCKCIVSEIAGSSCLIEEGKNGYTFDPYDKAGLVKLLRIMATQTTATTHELKPTMMIEKYENYFEGLVEYISS